MVATRARAAGAVSRPFGGLAVELWSVAAVSGRCKHRNSKRKLGSWRTRKRQKKRKKRENRKKKKKRLTSDKPVCLNAVHSQAQSASGSKLQQRFLSTTSVPTLAQPA